MNPGLAASCCVDPFGVFICPVLLSNNSNNNRPDIVVLEKEGRVQCFIVNVTSPFDTRVAEKETENCRSTTLRTKKWKCKLRSGTAEAVYLSSLL